MDRERAERQIRLVMVTYDAERRRGDEPNMVHFRHRAEAIFDQLEPQIADDPDVLMLLRRARRHIRRGLSAGGSSGEEPIDGGRQLVNGEGFQ